MPCGVGNSTPNEVKQNLIRTCVEVSHRLRGDNNVVEENDDEVNASVIEKTKPSIMIRADTDLRENYSPGWKFNHWELKVTTIF